ncbi:hypothetical protein JTB14_036620 [Gonioctena quinquepunctata]|nr:hypothetical protein JTB14_036620 [Gonioctena quinquepunctata]
MGLGSKTMQTIALLAHLACEKENWGPHLIVVPTSVMWKMQCKKWIVRVSGGKSGNILIYWVIVDALQHRAVWQQISGNFFNHWFARVERNSDIAGHWGSCLMVAAINKCPFSSLV